MDRAREGRRQDAGREGRQKKLKERKQREAVIRGLVSVNTALVRPGAVRCMLQVFSALGFSTTDPAEVVC